MSGSAVGAEWLLAIDTSTEEAGLALTNGQRTLESSWWAGRDQTVSVLAQIDRSFELAGKTAQDLAAIAVAIGPGMFNGLRVGLSVAKGLHLGSDAGLIGVSTFEVTAYPFRGLGVPVVAIVAAGRGRLVWQIDGEPDDPVNGRVTELVDVLSRRAERVLLAGDLSAEQAEQLAAVPGVLIPPPAARIRRPGVLAEIGRARFRSLVFDDPVTLAPVYVHGAPAPARG
jgi:tRNA threonylcarbamoyladenosine biosynthesis protein TsaB